VIREVDDEAVEAVRDRRAGWTPCRVLGPEHEVVDEELRASSEEIGEGRCALVGLEAVLLVDSNPGQLLPPARRSRGIMTTPPCAAGPPLAFTELLTSIRTLGVTSVTGFRCTAGIGTSRRLCLCDLCDLVVNLCSLRPCPTEPLETVEGNVVSTCNVRVADDGHPSHSTSQ
jgi:hypothetical protein